MNQHWAAWISVIVTVLTVAFVVASRFIVLEESTGISRTELADHERRIGAIERDRSSDTRFNNLEKSILELKWKVDALSDQLEKRHGR